MSHTWVELDGAVLRSNLRSIRAALAPATQLLAVVKSNAYGHGLLPVADAAWSSGVRLFGVADVSEGALLRRRFPLARVIVLGAVRGEDVQLAAAQRLEPVVVSETHARMLSRSVGRGRQRLLCHAKVDTGMGRLGLPWQSASDAIVMMKKLLGLEVVGICTHLAAAGADPDFSRQQVEHLDGVITDCRQAGTEFGLVHVSNSGGVMLGHRWHHDAVRVGIMMYGYGAAPGEGEEDTPEADATGLAIRTRPFLSWKTRIIQVKRVPRGFSVSYDRTYFTPHATTLATIDVGYADGYLRALSGQGVVLIGGRRCPVRGRVTMNLTVVDLGNRGTAKEGDEVVLIGRQGQASIWADELAGLAGTISYEIVTGIRTSDRR